MGKKDRAGKIENRRSGFREPDLGYYYIVTDAVETEPNFFNGLKEKLPDRLKGRLVIKVKSSKTYDMVDTILNDISRKPIMYNPWIIFDKDQVKEFDQIIDKAEKHDINVGWSNPCVEILFLSYFGKSPSVFDQNDCIKQFSLEYKKQLGKDYKKNNKRIYEELSLNGDEDTAINAQERKHNNYIDDKIIKPSEMLGVSTIYKLLKEIGYKKRMW